MTKRVLFVCMGNICRSPAGEAVMQRFAEEFRVDVEVDSAGTHGYHVGDPPDARMLAAAEARGYELNSQGRQVTPEDLEPESFDLVLAMDGENHAILQEMAGGLQTHIRMFSDYLDDVSTVYPDKDDLLRQRGELAVRLSDRSIDVPIQPKQRVCLSERVRR